jgi:SAM-dependent methyltransferase
MVLVRLRPWLKPLLLPLWNGGHRITWRVGEYRRVVPPRLEELWGLTPPLAAALARRESLDCACCGGKLRARRLAAVLLRTYTVGSPPAPARSVARWVRHPEARRLRVAEINRIDGLHAVLQALPHLAASDFTPGAAPGAVVEGVRNEDLTRLTYPDAAFDLVLSSETLEHVPDLDAALGEIRRVLVPGGRHIFTVPVLPTVAATFARAALGPDGSIVALAPQLSHPGGDAGYPVFTEFGTDCVEVFRRAGFETEVAFGPTTPDDLAQVYVCRKMVGPD